MYNKSIDGNFVANIATQGLHLCIRECLSRIGHCESVTYDRRLLHCKLTTGTAESDAGLLKSEISMLYTTASSWSNVRNYKAPFTIYSIFLYQK